MTERIFFTSDNHFWHKSILRFASDTRKGHTDVGEMNREMIEVWNSQVNPNDRVYTLGDFSFGNAEKTDAILRQLNGRKFLIKGNHDHWMNGTVEKHFEAVYDYKKITIDGHKVVMFHYPIVEFENMHHGAYHLYGHVHGNYLHPGRAMDVGIDARPQKDMGLWSWEEVHAHLKDRPVLSHHGKKVD